MTRLIAAANHTSALLIDEGTRMGMATDLALTASWLEQHIQKLGDHHTIATAAALVSRLHENARSLAADRAGEIYDTSDEAEDYIEQMRRLNGQEPVWNGPYANDTQRALNECKQKNERLQRIVDAAGIGGCAEVAP